MHINHPDRPSFNAVVRQLQHLQHTMECASTAQQRWRMQRRGVNGPVAIERCRSCSSRPHVCIGRALHNSGLHVIIGGREEGVSTDTPSGAGQFPCGWAHGERVSVADRIIPMWGLH
eukprot:181985-Amphidinium_carterae.1